LILVAILVVIISIIPSIVLAELITNVSVGMSGIVNSNVSVGLYGIGGSNLYIGMKSLEGNTMTANNTFIAIILIAIIGSIFAVYKRSVLFAIGASAAWFLLIAFTRGTYAIAPIGSSIDSIFIGVCVAFSIATMITTFTLRNSDEAAKQENYRKSSDYQSTPDRNRYNSKGSGYESAEDYQDRLRRLSVKRKK